MNKQNIVLGNSPNNPIAEKPFYAWKKTKENFDELFSNLQYIIDNGIQIDISSLVPITRTINGKTLNQNIILTVSDLGTNIYTTTEKNKLAGITNHYRGKYISLSALKIAIPSGTDGDTAIIDAGVGSEAQEAIWDSTDNVWYIGSGTPINVDQSIDEGSINAVAGGAVFSGLLGKQDSLNFTPEDSVNKVSDFTIIDTTTYPSTQAIKTELDKKVDKYRGKQFGYLYNAYVIDTGKLAPTGWVIPSESDFNTLISYLGGSTISGTKLKENSFIHWQYNTYYSTLNESGFSGVGSGFRDTDGTFNYLKGASFIRGTGDKRITLLDNSQTSNIENAVKKHGNSIRCMKNTDPGISTITDIDGNIYDVVHIGTQWWLKQNLVTTRYNDGTNIPKILDNTIWSGLTSDAYCSYNNDDSYAVFKDKQLSDENFTLFEKNKLANLFTTSLILKDFYTDVSTVGSSETDLYSYSVLADTLANDGDKLIFYVTLLSNASGATNSHIKFYIGSINLGEGGTTLGTTYYSHIFKCIIIRISSTNFKGIVEGIFNGSFSPTPFCQNVNGTLTFSSDNIFKITGQCATNEITAKFGYIEYKHGA